MPAVGKWSRRPESYKPGVPHEWPIKPLQQKSGAEYWMLISRRVQLHAAIIWRMLQMDAPFPRNSQDKLQIWQLRTTTLNNGLSIFDLDLMIYVLKAQSLPFWLKNKKETCKWRNGRRSAGNDTGSTAALHAELNGTQTLIKASGQCQREQEEKQK